MVDISFMPNYTSFQATKWHDFTSKANQDLCSMHTLLQISKHKELFTHQVHFDYVKEMRFMLNYGTIILFGWDLIIHFLEPT